MVHQVKDRVRNTQVTLVIALSTPMFGQTNYMYHQDVHFNTEFPRSRSTPGTQQAMLSLNEVPQ